MKPSITLTIQNSVPQLVYTNADGEKRDLIDNPENLDRILAVAFDKLDIPNSNGSFFAEAVELAKESSDTLLNPYTNIAEDSTNTELENAFREAFDSLSEIIESNEYDQIDGITDEIRDELNLNKNRDILASLLEVLYSVLIARAVIYASQMGLGEIYYEDDIGNARLRERLERELAQLGIGLAKNEVEIV